MSNMTVKRVSASLCWQKVSPIFSYWTIEVFANDNIIIIGLSNFHFFDLPRFTEVHIV